MDFYEVIRTRRSIRSYRPDAIPDDVLGRVLDAARVAPSGNNRQPWKFIIVKDAGLRRALAPLCFEQAFIAEAPMVVVATGEDIKYNRGNYMGSLSMLVDVAIAVDHLTLAARAEALGTCWIGSFDNEKIKRLLGIPADVQVVALTPLGYPTKPEFRPPGRRRPVEQITSVDRWK